MLARARRATGLCPPFALRGTRARARRCCPRASAPLPSFRAMRRVRARARAAPARLCPLSAPRGPAHARPARPAQPPCLAQLAPRAPHTLAAQISDLPFLTFSPQHHYGHHASASPLVACRADGNILAHRRVEFLEARAEALDSLRQRISTCQSQ